jgi:hypothetical protein
VCETVVFVHPLIMLPGDASQRRVVGNGQKAVGFALGVNRVFDLTV